MGIRVAQRRGPATEGGTGGDPDSHLRGGTPSNQVLRIAPPKLDRESFPFPAPRRFLQRLCCASRISFGVYQQNHKEHSVAQHRLLLLFRGPFKFKKCGARLLHLLQMPSLACIFHVNSSSSHSRTRAPHEHANIVEPIK
uniref:Uncharacterized protein n=1 Tax=Physcomitrium patens TaxID=3218 RepID=A0A2K1K4A0_PHYPA|nr:hypothetical protein PHYPA_013065 [Physcomitrium patens]